jgi:hypothetical protein
MPGSGERTVSRPDYFKRISKEEIFRNAGSNGNKRFFLTPSDSIEQA